MARVSGHRSGGPSTLSGKACTKGYESERMTEIVNLRTARKRAKRRSDDQHAEVQRLAYGRPTYQRALDAAHRDQESRALDGHKIITGERP